MAEIKFPLDVSRVGKAGSKILVADAFDEISYMEAEDFVGDKGDTGDKGWSVDHRDEVDGARIIRKLVGYIGGEGTPPSANIGKYLKSDGTYTAVKADAMDYRGGIGATGNIGNKGWTPDHRDETDGSRIIRKLVGYIGGEGVAPAVNVGLYLKSDNTYTAVKADAIDYRGGIGATGNIGNKGWTPDHRDETDGSRIIRKLVGYIGGEGAAPTANVGLYLKSDNTYTAVKADAMDYRGTTGITTPNLANGTLAMRYSAGTGSAEAGVPVGFYMGSDGKFYNGLSDLSIEGYNMYKHSNPVGAHFFINGASTGAIRLKPNQSLSGFSIITGSIFNFGNGETTQFIISFYGGSMYYGATAIFSGGKSYPVRWYGGTERSIYIGDVGTTHSSMSISIDYARSTLGNPSLISAGWTISLETSFVGTLSASRTAEQTLPNPGLNYPMTGYNAASGTETDITNATSPIQAIQNIEKKLGNRYTKAQSLAVSNPFVYLYNAIGLGGILITTEILPSSDTVFLISIKGNSYTLGVPPIDIDIQGIATTAGDIQLYSGLSKGTELQSTIRVLQIGGKLCVWFQVSNYKTFFVTAFTQNSRINQVSSISTTTSTQPTVDVGGFLRTITPIKTLLNNGSSANLILGDGSYLLLSTLAAFTATKLAIARLINGVSFDGTTNITIYDATKVAKTGDTMTGDLILNSATPPTTLSAAPKQYVDNTVNNAIAGLVFKTDVVAASVDNVNIASAPATLDGVTLANTNRILLKDQTDASQNGIWIFNGTGNALTRALDADTGVELANKTIPVTSGTVNADAWFKILNDTITIGTTNILFSKVGGDGNYTPGAQIQISGNTISVVEDSTHRFATDAEKTAWNGKASTIKTTASLSSTDINTNKYKEITVTGAAVGDLVEVVEKYFNAGTILYLLNAKVTATNTVRIYINKIYGNSLTEGETFFVVSALPSISIPQTINLVVFK